MRTRTKIVLVLVVVIVFGYQLRKNKVEAHGIIKETAEELELAEKIAQEPKKKNEKAEDSKNNEYFSGIDKLKYGETIGTIQVVDNNKESLLLPLVYGSDYEQLRSKVTIHQDLSNSEHLVILGHNNENFKGLENTMFSNNDKLETGDIVELNTNLWNYSLVVVENKYVSLDEFEADEYASTQEGDVCLVSCSWDKDSNSKGRRLVILEVAD